MTNLYDILETFAGTPADPFTSIVLYVAVCVVAVILVLGVIDIMHLIAKSVGR